MSVAYFTSLNYTYPIYDANEIDYNIPREVLLSQTLKLPRSMRVSKPMSFNIRNAITDKSQRLTIDPLEELLTQSRNQISKFMEESQQEIEGLSKSPIFQQLKIQKHPENNSKLHIITNVSNKSTPITNKTVYFSPLGKAIKRISTPVVVAKDLHQLMRRKSSRNLKQKLLRMDQASLVSFGKYQIPQYNDDPANFNEDNSDYDLLACHADNIMRMAVDSTMLGSTFNSSFSSSFSNSFVNDMNGKDFFDQEAKKTILEGINF